MTDPNQRGIRGRTPGAITASYDRQCAECRHDFWIQVTLNSPHNPPIGAIPAPPEEVWLCSSCERPTPVDEDEWRLRFIRRFPDRCCAEVSRGGESQPCDKTAVAAAEGDDDGDSRWWPVCAHHSRGCRMVPLAELLKSVDRSTQHGVESST